MIKRKELKPSEDTTGQTIPKKGMVESIEEDDVLELEEVVEEPDLLPVGDDLDELLKEDVGDDFDFDIEKLDSELGVEEDGKLTEEISIDVTSEEPKPSSAAVSPPPSSPAPSSQEAIDDLFQEALLEAESPSDTGDIGQEVTEAPVSKAVEPKPLTVHSQQDVEYIIDELEKRLMAKFETFVQQQLPSIVLETVRQELKALLKELEEQ
jgi:hypothetical protein